MRQASLLYPLLLLLLGLSCLLALGGAVPASRSLCYHHKLKQEAPVLSSMDQSTVFQLEQSAAKVVLDEASVRGRMDMQSFNDYPGSGPNTRHDPKPPGRP